VYADFSEETSQRHLILQPEKREQAPKQQTKLSYGKYNSFVSTI